MVGITRRKIGVLTAAGLTTGLFSPSRASEGSAAALREVETEDLLLFRDFMMEELGLRGGAGRGDFGPQTSKNGAVSLSNLSELAGFASNEQQVLESVLDFVETRDYAFSKEIIDDLLKGVPDYGTIDATFEWPSFDRAMDTHHLRRYGEPEIGAAFDITGDLLARLAHANCFDLEHHFDDVANEHPTLFIFRGCKLEEAFDAVSPWKEGVRVSYTPPVHASIRPTPGALQTVSYYNRRACILGAWDRATNKLTVVEANSIPTQDFARRTIGGKDGILNCSVLPTGFYRYYFGLMGNGKQAFRKEKNDYIVLRSPFDVNFDPFDVKDVDGKINTSVWTTGRYHHIHNTAAGTGYGAGCTIVSYRDRSWDGLLNALRRLDSLATLPRKSSPSTAYVKPGGGAYRFYGMVLSGAEAAMMALDTEAFAADFKRLRIGSGGRRYADTVKQYQSFARSEAAKLKINASIFDKIGDDGKFGRSTGIATLILNREWLLDAGESLFDHSAPIAEIR